MDHDSRQAVDFLEVILNEQLKFRLNNKMTTVVPMANNSDYEKPAKDKLAKYFNREYSIRGEFVFF